MNENEQVTPVETEETTIQDPTPELTEESTPFKVFQTEEEYSKAFKSEVSKAKYEWLKEIGAKSVDEYKASCALHEQTLSENNSLKQELETTKKSLVEAQDKNLVLELKVSDEYAQDALALAKLKVDDKTDLRQALTQILDKNPSWLEVEPTDSVKFGTEKEEAKKVEVSNLAKKYPWLQ